MTSDTTSQNTPEEPLPDELALRLQAHGVSALDEVALRRALERHAPTYTLFRLNPIAARKWKACYRIMLGERYLDCQSVAEAYARALLILLDDATTAAEPPPLDNPTAP
ncbi:MAG: hypothetical protein ACHQ1E_13480 [Ktedonobacterales bacterium]|jgi:hypothetical protein